MFRRLVLTFILGAFIALPLGLSMPIAEAQQTATQGTRCTGSNAEPIFLRFNYVPVPDQGYIENKAVIYVPKEAQCQGNFPMYIHLHGDNKYYDDMSTYYLPSQDSNGQAVIAHYRSNGQEQTSRGTNNFVNAIKAAYNNNPRIPGMVFVLPAKTVAPNLRDTQSVNWTGLNGNDIKRLVQEKLNSDPHTSNLHITLSNDLLASGHSGGVCMSHSGNENTVGLMQFANVNPIGVAEIDSCTNQYARLARTYPNATLLFYAADMAYSTATYDGNQVVDGYHNDLAHISGANFQDLASCDPAIFISPPNAAARSQDSTPHYGTRSASYYKAFWDHPILGCAKSSNHPWYGLFNTEIDHANAVGLAIRTLLNIVYSNVNPQLVNAPTQPTQNTNTTGQNPTNNNNTGVLVGTAPTVNGVVPLEVGINGVNAINGNNEGFIINYTRLLFLYAGGLAATLALIILIVAGIQLIIGGDGDKNTQSKQLIAGSITGLVLLAVSGWILYLINPCFFTFGTTSACVPRGNQPIHYIYPVGGNGGASSVNTTMNLNGTPPRPVPPTCANGVCDVVLNVPYINQTQAKRECEYANICATNPDAGTEVSGDHSTEKWGQVSCGAAAFSIAFMYVNGSTSSTQEFLDGFIHRYYRCGIHGLSPEASARINGYDAQSAPRTANDSLCGYVLGVGGSASNLVEIVRNDLGAHNTHSINLNADAIYSELSAGHPIVIGGVGALAGRTGGFTPRAHFTVLIGIQGYNATDHTFTNLVIHDVGHQASSIMTQDNYNNLRGQNLLQTGIALAM